MNTSFLRRRFVIIFLSSLTILVGDSARDPNAATMESVQYSESGLVGAWYLSFPLEGYDSSSQLINTVFDHVGDWYSRDSTIKAFTGETGDTGCMLVGAEQLCKQQNGQDFSIKGLYTSRPWKGGRQYLSYNGHPGYDFVASTGTSIYAPADGYLDVPASDPINGNPPKFNTFRIDHGNGYSTWYLHAQSHISPGVVNRGAYVGATGETGAPGAPHLHFEVRKNNGAVSVDPYGWEGVCRDPYTAAVNVKLWSNSGTTWEFNTNGNDQGWGPSNHECYSINGGIYYLDPRALDPYITGPPLVNVIAQTHDTIRIRMASNAPDGNGAIYFTTATSPDWHENKSVTFPVKSDPSGTASYNEYSVYMGGHSGWNGSITQLRIDPSEKGESGTSIDTVGIDFIRLEKASSLSVGCGASSSEIANKFVAAYNTEGASVLGQPTSCVGSFTDSFYSPAITGYYQEFNGTWTRAVIDYLPGTSAAYSVKYGFSQLFYSQDSDTGQLVYKLVVAPTANEARSGTLSPAGTDYTWQPFLKGSFFFYHSSPIGGGISDWKTYTWGYFSERYERERGRFGNMGLPLFPPANGGESGGWIWWYQWFEKGFIWQATSPSGDQAWTLAYSRNADVYSPGNWNSLGWYRHK